MKKVIFIFALCSFTFIIKNASAWDTVIGHPDITLSAINKASNLDRFMGDFGLTSEMFNSQDSRDFGPHSAKGWIFLGSIWEDYSPDHATTCLLQAECRRFLNHYYDPVNKIGLNYSGYGGGVAPIWGKTGEGVDGPNQWSWSKARYYLLNALTAGSEEGRNKNFAFAFRSLGQVVHLLEDMSQPGHVRNDPHVSPSDDILGSMTFNPSKLEEWANNNGSLVSGYAASSGPARAYPAFDNYFNGLAAISNTNFLSDDTIFKNYSMPSEEQTGVVYDAVEDGDGHSGLGIYYVKTGGLLTGHKLANAGYLWYDLSFRRALKAIIFDTALKIDDKVAQENAQKLIPLAVEFSSGLINYFFRGQIDMKPDTQNAGNYIIENLSNEDMSGAFSLYYDDENDNRNLVTSWNLSISAGNKSEPIEFTEPTDAKEKGKYMLVFQGTLGAEEGAVAGKVVTLEEKKELILYAVNGVYKTFDPETKEVKPYSGILQGATGRVVWRADGDAAWATYGNSLNIVNTDKNTVNSSGFPSGATVGWKGETPIAMQIQYKSPQYYIFYSEFLPDGGFADYAFASPGDINRVDYTMSQFSWDGEEMTGIGYREPYYNASSGDYYLINLNTVVKELSAVKVGRASGYSATNVPVSIAYYDDSLNVIYRNGDGARSVQGDYACPDSQITENLSSSYTYDLLGAVASSLTRTTTCYATLSQQQGTYFWPVISYTIMKDGQAVVLYSYQEFSSSGSSSPYFSLKKSRMTPYLYIGGNKYADASAELNSNSGANLYTNYESLVNLNGNKNKAIAMLRTRSYAYNNNGAYDVAKTAMVYYISDGSVSNIINDNPDFKDATFFTFIKE